MDMVRGLSRELGVDDRVKFMGYKRIHTILCESPMG